MKRELQVATRSESFGSDAVDPTLVDEFVGSYVCWREARAAVWEAYAAWADSTLPHDCHEFETYWASLDREEQAAVLYAGSVRRVAAAAVLKI